MRWELIVTIHDFLVNTHWVVIIERWIARKHLEHEHTQRPPVNVFIVAFRLNDFRCQVLRRAAQGVCLISDLFSETKVGNFHVTLLIYQQILRFQVSVSNVHSMQVVKRQQDLACEEQGHIIGEPPFPPEQGEQLTTTGIVKEHVDVGRRLEVTLEVHDERVIYDCESGFLTLHVVDLLQLDYGVLLEALEGQRLFVCPIESMLDKPDPAECSSAKRRKNLEII